MKNNRFYYLVEGACEKKMIDVFKEEKNLIISGKVTPFNVIQDHITSAFLRTIPENTTVILVFDTDTNSTDILEANIQSLSKSSHIKEIWCVTQVKNLEDELLRSTNVSEVKFLTGSKSNKEFKHDLIIEKRLFEKLKKHNFNFSRFWSSSPTGIFSKFNNQSIKIKLKK